MSTARLAFAPLSYTGWGSLDKLVPEVTRFHAARILIVTDPILEQIGLTDRVKHPLVEAGLAVDVYTGVVPEPPLEVGEALVAYTREHRFDLIIGLGGGSALDLTKLAAVLAVQEGSVSDYLAMTATRTLSRKGLPKILIPTTAGTGSEITNISVLTLPTTKDVIAHDFLLADVAIVDPQLTLSMPPRVTAATGIDALTHAIEAYVSLLASPTTDGLALQAVRMISQSLPRAVRNGSDKEARTAMSHASYMAGIAFFNAGVAAVHALAYPLGGQFHLSHGDSNAVLLPYVMGYIRKSCTKRLADLLNALGGNSAYVSEEDASIRCIEAIKRLVAEVGIPTTLQQFGIPESALDALTDDGVLQKRLLARSPMPLAREDIRAIYQAAFDGVIAEAP
ncbi:iron-containing alcohol dehydrogenase [Brevibacillus fluminis]|uniref:iron-containing alcohol dehydrogenase n=1 Tax=Brevibacillus fluminis TaxID=511487 RepID=UPI003F8B2499